MLTFPSSYSSALSSPFEENWIVRLYSDSTNYIGISFQTITMGDGVTYTGCILNKPTIRESVDFTTGKSNSGNISLSLAEYTINNRELSEELFTQNYINRTVQIYSVLNGSTSMTNAFQLFEGRLMDVQYDETSRLNISIVAKRPWDGINLPNVLSDNNVYIPVAYGDFTGNDLTSTAKHKFYPAPFGYSEDNLLYYFTTQAIGSGAKASYYASGSNHFPYMAGNSATQININYGKDALGVLNNLNRTFRIKPTEKTSDWSNESNALDESSTTYASKTLNSGTASGNPGGTTVNATSDLEFGMPSVSGKITSAILYVHAYFDYDYSGDTGSGAIYDFSWGNNTIILDTGNTTTSGSVDISNSGSNHLSIDWTSDVEANDNKLPDSVKLRLLSTASSYVDGDDTDTDAEGRIYDVWLKISTLEDYENEPASASKGVEQLKKIYIGNDGLDKSWSVGSATKSHEIHRDILYRFLDITTTPNGWSDITTQKTGETRFFTPITAPKPVSKYLNKLAYEGGFVFRFRNDGTPVYHFIHNSPSTDTTLTHADISGLQIQHDDLTSLITDWTVQYDKSPAKSQYESKATHTSTNRTNYGFSTNENKKDIKLNHLITAVSKTAGDRNDSFLNYYDSILGDIKQNITFTLNNPTKSNIEVGDVLAFSSMKINSLSGGWSEDWIVTSTKRSIGGQLSISAREI